MSSFFAVWFILGAAVGSFLNVCIYRLPRGESVIFPPSACPQCRARLKPWDLVPIFSYLLLRGKCRYCGGKISSRYPLVETISGLAFALIWGVSGGDWINLFFQLLFTSVLIVIFFIDYEHQVIPDAVSVPGIFAGLIYNFLRAPFPNPFISALLGMLLGYVLLYGIAAAGKEIFKKEAMGEGDLYLAALLGAFLGWSGVLLSLFLGCLLAGLVLLVLLPLGKVKMGQYVPFGPALAAGGMITLFLGERIINWYLGVFL